MTKQIYLGEVKPMTSLKDIKKKFGDLKNAFIITIKKTGGNIKSRVTKVTTKGGNLIIFLKNKIFKKKETKQNEKESVNNIAAKIDQINEIKEDLKQEELKEIENNVKKEE